MTDEQFGDAVHALSGTLTAAVERRGIRQQEAGKVLTATLAQSLAQLVGPVAAIERLRDMADLMEAQILQENTAIH